MKKYLDFSDYYQDELNNLKVSSLNELQMRTFLCETIDNEDVNSFSFEYEYKDLYFDGYSHCNWLANSIEHLKIKLDDKLFVDIEVSVTIDCQFATRHDEFKLWIVAVTYRNHKIIEENLEVA